MSTMSLFGSTFLATTSLCPKPRSILQSAHLKRANVVLRSGRPTGSTSSEASTIEEGCDADKLVDGMSFGQLCDDFQCISSPSVEASCRQLARDIIEMRDGNRALGTFAYFAKYKDPLRSFQGREKFARPLWAKKALEQPKAAVRQMEMTSTSTLKVEWTVRGRAKAVAPLDVVVKVTSSFTLNQISGQVLEQEEVWDVSGCSPAAQAYFWLSRLAYSAAEAAKDTSQSVSRLMKSAEEKEQSEDGSSSNNNIFVDPTDPKKFFQIEDNPQRDLYQLGLLIALLYLLVQFLKLTL